MHKLTPKTQLCTEHMHTYQNEGNFSRIVSKNINLTLEVPCSGKQ